MQSIKKKIRVMIVDDSLLARRIIRDGLSAYSNMEIVGEAGNAAEARAKLPLLRPDVMTLDVEMPGMNGIDFVKSLLPQHPVPIILVSSLNLRVFDAMAVGAVDFVRKPETVGANQRFIEALANKIVVASCARIRRSQMAAAPAVGRLPLMAQGVKETIIAIGASTGGTEATLEVIKRLPADTPGIVVVQHMPPGFTKMYADRLDKICAMKVKEAENGDAIERGRVLIAPGDKQMRVVRTGNRYTVSCQFGEKVSGHCPSVDVLFHSVAQSVRCRTVGIILTGMGRDGADGLLDMRRHGAYTIGQDKESSVVYGMPMVAHDIGAVVQQAACENIAAVLLRHLNNA
ncbi:protein-glutamate methylesterase/protein-glutamine glutaminase [Agathobaculum desmolans]|uniref:protein-glutamate methylesterase/protein-glutamine glutaminase n=1 Tax=Agathobaculum desmolans TaxID=39484 RepID=UPI0004E1A6D8|nr:chemotaxis response regulator protein-glutamate methylesterase [Agathobaculum desmolans]